ncbi:MAG: hypothetical protein U0354_17585 [Candidatus Sericytochromatia bacterium]
MEDIKGVPDISIRFNNSKANIQINPKLSGSQSINFQEILTNIGETNQTSILNTSQQNINIDSIQSQNSDNNLEQNNSDNKNINNDKNAPTAVKSQSNTSSQTTLFSEYIPQKPLEVEKNKLNLDTKEKNQGLILQKSSKKNIPTERKKLIKSNSLEIVIVNETKSSGVLKQEENIKDNKGVPKKEINHADNIALKNNYQDEREEKRRNIFYYENEEIASKDIVKILETYGLEIPEFLSKGGEQIDENWVKNLIFGSLKENLNNEDSEKISKFITAKNPEQIAEKDKKVFTKLVNEIFKNQVTNINPEILTRFEKNSSEFILKNFPHIIYNGSLKKYFDTEDNKIKNTRLKMLISLINNEKIEEDDIKNSFITNNLEPEEKENCESLINGDYLSLNNDEIYKTINKTKNLGFSFGSFLDNVHEIIISDYENKLSQKLKQTTKILTDYRKYNFINESDSHFLANSIVNKHFNNENLSNNKLADIMTRLINGEYIEPVYLELINQTLSKNLLSYLPNTINYQVAEHLKSLPFSKNEVVIQEKKDYFRVFIKIKFKQIIKSITLFNPDTLDYLNLKTNDKNIIFTDLEISSYRIQNIETEEEKIIDLSKFDKNFSLDFSIDKKLDIFYFGTLDIKSTKNNETFNYKLKNEYQNFLSIYKKKYPELFKNKILKLNPKLFK